MTTQEALTLSRKTETDAMHWMLLQAFMGRAVSVTHVGREVRLRFGAEIDAEQFQRFIVSADRRNP